MIKKSTSTELKIQIPKPNRQLIRVKIKGIAPLIYSQFSQKAVRSIEDKQQKTAGSLSKKEKRNIEYEAWDSFYRNSEGFLCLPARNIKNAMVDTGKVMNTEMTLLRKVIWVVGEDVDGYIPVTFKGEKIKIDKMPEILPHDQQPPMGIIGHFPDSPKNVVVRRDYVRLSDMKRTTDLRYRGCLLNWEMNFVIKYNGNIITPEQVMYLLQEAGTACGLGEWRNERNGDFGLFELAE